MDDAVNLEGHGTRGDHGSMMAYLAAGGIKVRLCDAVDKNNKYSHQGKYAIVNKCSF